MTVACTSVILPVFNGAQHLALAMRSVLTQSLPPHELIVIDDGSTDDTAAIITSLATMSSVPIRYVRQSNQGPAAARNAGLRLATGATIAFQDADDLWAAEKLAVQTALLQHYTQAHGVIGYAQLAYAPVPGSVAPVPVGQPGLILLLQASLFRRDLFDRVGSFDPALRGDEDVEWFLRLLEHPVALVVHPDLVVTYCRHAANLTGTLQQSRRQLMIALQRALARRRRAAPDVAHMACLIYAQTSPQAVPARDANG